MSLVGLSRIKRLRKPSDLKPTDSMIIWLFGVTGGGKTILLFFLILSAIGVDLRCPTRHRQLKSQTQTVQAVRLRTRGGKSIVLVDTPGFDSADLSHPQVLSMISPWLKQAYQIGITEQKAIYVHQISENRVNRSIMELFLNMIGKAFAKQAILVTTMWNELSDDEVKEAAVREAMLQSLLKDARLQRFDCTSASASNIFQEIVTSTGNRSNLALQEELVNRGLHLSETMAGRCLYTQELALLHGRVKSAYDDTSRKSLALGNVLAAEQEAEYERLKLELNRGFDKMAAIPFRWKIKEWFRCKFALVIDGTDLF